MRRKIGVLLGLCVLTTSISVNASVREVLEVTNLRTTTTATTNEGEATKSNLEKIVLAIKAKITIPKELSEFEYYYNSDGYNLAPHWNLTWMNEGYSKRISVTCDDKGNVINYYYLDDKDNEKNEPKYLKSELKDIADKFIKKIAPSIYSNLKYIKSNNGNINSGYYTYNYERIENGVSMPDNGVSITVNYETKKALAVNINWLYGVKIPTKDTIITREKAAKIIGSQMKMILSYENSYDQDEKGKTKIKTFLAFQPEIGYLSVDAKTGKVYTTKNEWADSITNSSEASKEDSVEDKDSGKSDSIKLTEAEIKKIKELEGLIDKSVAISKIRSEKSLLLDESLSVVTANLSKENLNNSDEKTNYVWNISFSAPISKKEVVDDIYTPYASASIDAKTGKILSFRASVKNYYDVKEEKWDTIKVNYTKKEALLILEKFLNTQVPERLKNSKITSQEDGYIVAYKEDQPVYGGYNFNYNRVNEGVEYAYNGIHAMVDGVTGKIYSFNSNWDDKVTFKSPKGAITATEAFDKYIALEGYGLVYEINNIESVSKEDNSYTNRQEVRLVYRADIYPSLISAFTGKQIDYDGKDYINKKEGYSYTDISSHKYLRSIQLLSDIGIGFEGDKFLPDNKITAEEMETLLININYNIIELTAKEKTKKVTRIDIVKRLVQVAGLDKVAKLKNIYIVDFEDKDSIAKTDLGYVALAKGLGIISGKKLELKQEISRAQAADMIIKLLTGQSKLRD